mmetsp:Transcript_18991/g.40047  ORF Transcript_18991/g.40047 Transcript_18991/m.40047 type:complete len:488 (+) Transcript_18991:136-1599(+)
MLSFLNQHLSESKSGAGLDTGGLSAHVYTGGHSVQIPRDTTRLRVHPSVKHLDGRVDYGCLFSMELPKSAIRMDVNLTQGTSCLPPSRIIQAMSTMISDAKVKDIFKSQNLKYLRNIAFPPDLVEKNLPTFDNQSELGRILPSKRNPSLAFSFMCNGYSLRDRFNGLRIHRICYYHSYDSAEVALRELRNGLNHCSTGNERDCLGMTPLHILACSTKQWVDMFQLLIDQYPEQLVTEDHWGDIPLFYSIWGRAPLEIVDLLVDSMKIHHPNYKVGWVRMVETLCLAMAPTSCLEYLIEMNLKKFEEHIELCTLDWALMVDLLCTKARASEDHVNKFINTFETFFPENNIDLQARAAQLIRREKFGFQKFWLRIGISSRLVSLEKREWREELDNMVGNCPRGSSSRAHKERIKVLDSLHRKVDVYEVYELMWLLELALWKAKMESSVSSVSDQDVCYRSKCRVMCGAPIIVPKVVAFLLPEVIKASAF